MLIIRRCRQARLIRMYIKQISIQGFANHKGVVFRDLSRKANYIDADMESLLSRRNMLCIKRQQDTEH